MSFIVEQSIRPSILLLIVISTFTYEKLIRNMLQTSSIDSYEKFHYFQYIKNRWSRISPRLGNEMLSVESSIVYFSLCGFCIAPNSLKDVPKRYCIILFLELCSILFSEEASRLDLACSDSC
jgi:hypothetical protein